MRAPLPSVSPTYCLSPRVVLTLYTICDVFRPARGWSFAAEGPVKLSSSSNYAVWLPRVGEKLCHSVNAGDVEAMLALLDHPDNPASVDTTDCILTQT